MGSSFLELRMIRALSTAGSLPCDVVRFCQRPTRLEDCRMFCPWDSFGVGFSALGSVVAFRGLLHSVHYSWNPRHFLIFWGFHLDGINLGLSV